MFSKEEYQLLDFGRGEKLEQFGGLKVRRPSPVASEYPREWSKWEPDCLAFTRGEKHPWSNRKLVPDPWTIRDGSLVFELRPTPFGHLGLFPEQAGQWQWLRDLPIDLSGARALNLFAYTGGTSLALAARGAQVVHVDSSRSVVQWARKNAEHSGLSSQPIRWIVEDAMTFARRELNRNNRYDIVIADPPSFGHGIKRQAWKFDRDVQPLVELLAELSQHSPRVLLLTAHTTGYDESDLANLLHASFPQLSDRLQVGKMELKTLAGRTLPTGYFVRYFETRDGSEL